MGGSQLNLLSSVVLKRAIAILMVIIQYFWVCILPNYSVQAPDFCVFLCHSKG